MNKKHFFIGIVGVVISITLISIFANKANESPTENSVGSDQFSQLAEGITEGKLAKDFSLATIEGNVVKLSDFRGKYVLFAFMATWCTPCQIEALNIKKVQDNFENIPLVVMQIDVDPRERKQDLIKFRERFGKEDWIMGFDNGSVAQLYNVRTFDTTILVNPNGKIVYRDNGFPISTKNLEDLIVKSKSSGLVLGSAHEHANISVIFGGKNVDFSQNKYQLRSPFVHFEEGNGKVVHVHAKGVTLKYLFETLGWKIEKGCIVTEFGKYCNGTIKVNGGKADIGYEIKNGEFIEVVFK